MYIQLLMMGHAGNEFNNKARTNTSMYSLLFVWHSASTSGKTNTTKRPQTWQLENTLSQIAGSNISGRETQTPHQLPSITSGILWWWQEKQITQFEFDWMGLELKSCLRPNCVDQPVWAFVAVLSHNILTDQLSKQTTMWIPTARWLKLQIVFHLHINTFFR